MIMFLSIVLLTLFLITGREITRIEGFILASLYVIYIYWLLSKRDDILKDELGDAEQVERKLDKTTAAYAFMVTLGLLLALFSAHHLVVVASDLAVQMMIPHAVIGTTVSSCFLPCNQCI